MNFNNLMQFESTILDGIENYIPSEMDAEILKSEIFLKCGMMVPLYTDWNMMHTAILHFFMTHAWNINRLWAVTKQEYNPIENYDRKEDSTRNITRKNLRNIKNDRKSGYTQTDETDGHVSRETGYTEDVTASGTSAKENLVSAYNATEYQADTKENLTTSNTQKTTNNANESSDNTGNYTSEYNATDSDTGSVNDSGTDDDVYTSRTHGNIGVTTTQQMLEAEINLMRNYNVYEKVVQWIQHELFLGFWD